MYLSRVEIDSFNRRKIRELTHLGAYHNWVESSFPNEFETGEKSRKLWRIDRVHGKNYLLVVSDKKPDLTALEKYGVEGSGATKNYEQFLSQIRDGQTYRFKAVLNPVYSVHQDNNERGKVVPEITVEQQLKFLENRAEKYGFKLIENNYAITERKREILRKERQKPIKISKVTYEGLLTVTSSDLLKNALINGIGREKAYGCGMMTIIPAY